MSLALPLLVRPYAEIDFLRKDLDSRITFTRASGKTYFDANGVMQTAGSNVAPLEYDPVTLAPLGRSAWQQRTNLFLNGNYASRTNCTLVPNATTDMFGNNTGVAMTSSAAGAVYYASASQITFTSGAFYCARMYIKKGAQRYVSLQSNSIAVNGFQVRYDLDNVVVSGIGQGGGSIRKFGDIYELNAWGTVASTGGVQYIYVIPLEANGTSNRIPTTAGEIGYYFLGGQVESGLFPSPYIPTTTALVTRSSDNYMVNDLASLKWTGAAQTIYFETMVPNTTGQFGLAQFADATDTNDNDWIIYSNNGIAAIATRTYPGSTPLSGSTVAYARGVFTKYAAAADGTGSAVISNVDTIKTGAQTSASVGLTRLSLGRVLYTTTLHLNGYMKKVRVYPRRLSTAELQALTA